MKKYTIVFLTILAIMTAVGCTGSNNANNYQPGNSAQATQETTKPALEILNSQLVKEEYVGYSVKGTAKANKDLTYGEVSVKAYGSDGAVLGSYITNINNLKSGETWNFKVLIPVESSVRVANYTIANGNSW